MSGFARKTENKKEAGLALIWVLMVLAVTSALSLAFLQKVSIGIATTGTRSNSIQAQYLAEAAANHAIWGLLNQESFAADSEVYYMHSLGNGRYGYKVRHHTNTTFATVAVVGGVGDTVVHQSYVIYVKDAWYKRTWKYRRKISIPANVTDTDLTYFPYMVKVNIDDTEDDLFMNAQLDGDDILFTDSDRKTKLDHELEKYTSLDGIEEQVAWVKLPLLSSSDATEIYMYYGNHQASNQENPVDIWSNNGYESVYHLHDDFEDSVGKHDGTNTGSSDVDELIADAQDFDPADGVDYIDIGQWSVSGEELTIQAWIRSDDEYEQDDPFAIAKANGTRKDDFVWGMGLTGKKDDQVRFYLKTGMDDDSGTEELKSSSKLSKNTWHHVAMTYDASLSLMRIIKDGQDDGTKFQSGDIRIKDWQIHIGNIPNQDKDGQYSWDGKIDEVRISKVARSVDWMMAEYRNQNSPPETYLSLEAEEHRYLGDPIPQGHFDFDSDNEGFLFSPPNPFRDTSESYYASGDYISSGGYGYDDSGALRVQLGGIDDTPITEGMSGGWEKTFVLDVDSDVSISFVYKLEQTPAYESDELSQVLVKVDSTLYGEGGGWWNTDWRNRTKITFDNSASAENLDDFPVLVTLNTTNLTGLDLTSKGADVRFIDAITGNELKYEVESWDAGDDTATVWVKVPRINAGSAADYIYVYYNYNGTATYDQSAADEQAVWDSNYQAVYHLNETVVDEQTSGTHIDSTGTNNGNQNGNASIPGLIGGAQDFDGTDDNIDVGNVIGTSNAVTLSTWIKHDNLSATIEDYFSIGTTYLRHDGGNSVGQLHFYIEMTDDTKKHLRKDDALTNDAWYNVVGTWDGTTQRVFIDGEEKDSQTPGGTLDFDTDGWLSSEGEPLDGTMDEVRISNTARSAAWIKASYLSQSGTFASYTFSGEGAGDYVAQIAGDGDGGSAISTGWKRFRVDLGTLTAGTHTFIIGGYNNQKTDDDERTEIIIDDVIIWK